MTDDIRTVSLENGTFYYYTTGPYSLTNALDAEIAQLTEYRFSLNPAFDEVIYKLYKTDEGNWYELNDRNSLLNSSIIHALKKAMDDATVES